MSELIRLGAGQIAAFDLLNTSGYLVSNFPRQSDMVASQYWSASQPNKMLLRETRPSLGRGGGNYYGGFSGAFNFFMLTEDMRHYIHNTIMGGKPYATVTVYMQTTVDDGFQVMVGELVNPFATNAESDYETFGYEMTHTNSYLFRRGRIITEEALLLEDGTELLLEDGTPILLENQ